MSVPCATYRLQFRAGMTFERAAGLAPYWRALGISHLYASPVFAAAAGSTHGYDMVDANTLDPDLGGEAAFRRMVAALRGEGLGLVVDFVPNHMAATAQNPWWRDVLKRGEGSAYARHFDIDWAAGPLTLPFLGESFEAAAQAGKFALEPAAGGYALRYLEAVYPLNDAGGALIDRARAGGADLDRLAGDPDFLARLHAAQHWRLAAWRTGRHTLSYRRFFEITGLVGLRVEDRAVFADVHAKLFDLVDEGLIDGIRLDHIDGLADPAAYLRRLRERIGADLYLIVEKILEPAESLRADWPVAGTTGYEFIADLAALLTTGSRADALDRAYRAFTGDAADYEAQLAAAKREIVDHNLAAERAALADLAHAACAAAWPAAGWRRDALAPAVAAAASSVPVYRTYVDADGASPPDRALIAEIAEQAAAAAPERRAAVAAVAKLLALEVPAAARPAALAFTTRFQQTTGAVMAKALEDTVFYRFNRLAALNEVGGDPSRIGGGVADWHGRMERRAERMPHGLSATATHDTKRGEDARARLYTIAEAPEQWRALVERWAAMVRAPDIDRQMQWLLFQALLGVWPPDPVVAEREPAALAGRFEAYAEKAVREAQRQTSWADPDAAYEARVRGFAHALFADDNAAFRADFAREGVPFIRAGAVNGLAQLLLKLTAPGVPDVYQGTEGWDLSLVDPDNRRPPDYAALARAADRARGQRPAEAMADWTSAAPKAHLLTRGLALRAADPELFARGGYRALAVAGLARHHLVAFARVRDARVAVAVAPRCVFGQVSEAGPLALSAGWLAGTTVDLRRTGTTELRDVLTGETVAPGLVDAGELLRRMPVALLASPD